MTVQVALCFREIREWTSGFSSLCVRKTWRLPGKFEKFFIVARLDDIFGLATALFRPRSKLQYAADVSRHELCGQQPGII